MKRFIVFLLFLLMSCSVKNVKNTVVDKKAVGKDYVLIVRIETERTDGLKEIKVSQNVYDNVYIGEIISD